MSKKTIAAVVIMQNEEMNIPFAIHNPLLIYDSVILVDGGSTDNTIDVAEKKARALGMEHKLNIYFNKFKDLNSQRNFYLKKVKTDFMHYIDCDELYSENDLKKIRDNYINKYNCILIRSHHYYIDFYHIAFGNSWELSWKMPRCFKNISGLNYTPYEPHVGDHDLRIDNIPYTEYWKNSIKLCDINDIVCHHIGHAMGRETEHKKIMFHMQYDNPELRRLSNDVLNQMAWQSCYFDPRFWEQGINADPIGVISFKGKHPEIMQQHPLYNKRVIKDENIS
ncbi:MAG: glycosyltransferase [Candidatus Nanoarchaeia archaeon]|nr:glycosyltransferase [Candidatus Nanoarchaeia archaeon]